jgi:hypothetical protein
MIKILARLLLVFLISNILLLTIQPVISATRRPTGNKSLMAANLAYKVSQARYSLALVAQGNRVKERLVERVLVK